MTLIDLVPAALRRAWASDGICPDVDLYSLFRVHRLTSPGRMAVIDEAGETTYADLDHAARTVAVGLGRLGVCPGDVVGVQLPNGREAVIADLAIAGLGAVALPFPAGRGRAEAVSLLGRSGARAVIAAADHRGQSHAADLAVSPDLPALRSVIAVGGPTPAGCVSWEELLRSDAHGFLPARPDPDDAARILVSSGSEAEPKMVAYSHNALAGGRGNFLESLIGDDRPLRCLFLVPLASAFGSNGTPVTVARHGGGLILLSHFSATAALNAIRAHRPTHVLAVPAMIRMMLEAGATGIPPMTALVLGGAELDQRTADEAAEAFGCPVVNLYGSADGVNCHSGLSTTRPGTRGPGVPVGFPDPKVADIRIGDEGEIIARGPMTPMCYVGAPDLNERYRTAGGWVRTGDLGLIDEEGRLRLIGRLKQVAIRGGRNISLAETEQAIAAHPDVRDVVCAAVPDPMMGERLGACVVMRAGLPAFSLEELCAHLRAHGLEVGKHPERLLVVAELPLTPAGKPDRRAIATLLQAA
ncbi:2,3-dihydroxybenzoate-AMP ligase [Acrocarpospora phusangensis]|uniref:2,3-dihydroxybenzoate-AMP ligase n=1 Tax=Acrocarpospora phusangensis TaxID=1070424 RepID=A0A919Q735_9ACTN|nr:class I adenylate-forming enzyme family protein [Acrocarpospora phusangensis]GIH23639.1 2,3-dihydroxybenzoate-AMP ligase [Acrocarpospora phusangensis]